MDLNLDKIASFWKWFSDHNSELAAQRVSQVLVDELEKRLFSIHRLDWELGPGISAQCLFALSPRGDRQLLHLTRTMVELAPKLQGWEFHPAKPPRKWNMVFNLMVNGNEVEINGKLWEFVAYKFKDGTYDLLFKPENKQGLLGDYSNWAATIIADGELGEEKRMDIIKRITTVAKWDEKEVRFARRLEPGLLVEVLQR